MKPESRTSFFNRSFRRSFRRTKKNEDSDESAEEKLLQEFRKCVADVDRPKNRDSDYRRFLQARDYNVEEAEKLFRLDSNYRKMLDVENILENYVPPEVNMKYNITGLLGCDKEGSPIRVLNLGLCDFKGFLHALSTSELIKIFLWFMSHDLRYLEESNQKSKRNVEDFLYIVNLDNFGMNQLMYKPVIDMAFVGLKLLQDHFFDMQKAIIIVNAPSFYSSCYKLFKPVIQEFLDKKVTVYGCDDDWKSVLLSRIDADILPVYLGGTRVGPNNDSRCSDVIGQGGQIPDSYFPSEDTLLHPDDPDVTIATVAAGSFLNVPFSVMEAGSTVHWHIESKENDIGIGIFYEPLHVCFETPKLKRKGFETPKVKRKGCETPKIGRKYDPRAMMSRLEQLTPIVRCHCHINPEVGFVVSWKPGLHIVHFDNSYSWLNSKQVMYKIQVKPPNVKTKGSTRKTF